jgi:hypothetical protein
MATVEKKGLPNFWVTWLCPILAGDNHCEYAPWFRSRFKYDKQPRDTHLETWQLEHTAMVQATVATLHADGWTVTLEGQNAFRLTGKHAILAGKPDIIARKGDQVKVIDCKTGQPSTKDVVQVCVYLIVIPLVWRRPDLWIEGELHYKTHTTPISAEYSASQVKDRLFALLRKLGTSEQAPPTVPSERECAWCDIAACADRWTAAAAPAVDVETVLF